MVTGLWMSWQFGTLEGYIWGSQQVCFLSWDCLWLGTCLLRQVLTNLTKSHFIRDVKCNGFSKPAPKSNVSNHMTTKGGAFAAVMNWSCLWLYWDNWGNINLRNFMESRLPFLIIIMMIKIIPAVFIKYCCCSIYKILANSLQWLLCKDISVSAIIYYFFILSLSSHLNVTMYVRAFLLISL